MNKEKSLYAPTSPTQRRRSPSGADWVGGGPKRFFSKHKTKAVLRILRGEARELVSREFGRNRCNSLHLDGSISGFRDTGICPKEPGTGGGGHHDG